MNSSSESFDQPTQEGTMPGKKLTSKQKASIFAGLGGAAALGTIGTALAWGMRQDGTSNADHSTPEELNPGTENEDNKPPISGSSSTPATHKPESAPANSPEVPSNKVQADPENNAKPETPQNDPSADSKESEEETDISVRVSGDEPRMATSVTDEMSQVDALKAARAEVGPGGFFEWHGHYYNTFLEQEWENMSAAERKNYIDSIYKDEETSRDFDASADTKVTEVTNYQSTGSGADIHVGEYEGHTVGLGDTDHDGDAEVIVVKVDNGMVGAVDTDNDGIMDTEVELAPETNEVIASRRLDSPFEAPDMDILDRNNAASQSNHFANTTDTDKTPTVFLTEVESHEVLLGDTDQDGYVDVLLADNGVAFVDTDGDHKFDVGMAFNTETGNLEQIGYLEQEMDVPQFEHTDSHDNLVENQDYDNNSDVSDWA